MIKSKLTEEDKKKILNLYRDSDETTKSLAARYGVSGSTISRFLKDTLTEEEYDVLISQKRLGRSSKSDKPKITAPSRAESKPVDSSSTPTVEIAQEKPLPIPQPTSFEDSDNQDIDEIDVTSLEEMLGEELSDDDDLEDDEVDELEETSPQKDSPQISRTKNTEVKILPLQKATLPKTCYLVIDRRAELITKPLKYFAHLGAIPNEELEEQTLPVFDNHRVAKRFSPPSARIIKVHNGRMIEQTSSHLRAKGITRILLDREVFSLASYQSICQ